MLPGAVAVSCFSPGDTNPSWNPGFFISDTIKKVATDHACATF